MEDYKEIVNSWLQKFNNEYLKRCDIDNIDIWELQKSLKENDLIEIDFFDNATIMVAKNEIYVSVWRPICIPVNFLPIWNINMYENFDNYDYIQLQNNDNNYWYRIAKRLVEKCNYTMNSHYTKEKVLNEIKKYLN